MTNHQKYWELFAVVPSLMQSNINDDIEYDPEDENLSDENLEDYIELILNEVEYEREENYDTYTKEECDTIENKCNYLKQ